MAVDVVSAFGERVEEIVAKIEDAALQRRIVEALGICTAALSALDRLDVAREPLGDIEGRLDTHTAVAWLGVVRELREIIIQISKLTNALGELFPVTVHLTSTKAPRDATFDSIDPAMAEGLGRSVGSLAEMLAEDFERFSGRLKQIRISQEPWIFLEEIQDFRSRGTQCLEAIVATLLRPFTSAAAEEVLPRHREATERAARLRAVVVDLLYDVSALNREVMAATEAEGDDLRLRLVRRLEAFRADREFPHLWPQNRREFERVGRDLANGGMGLADLRRTIEGLNKFIEVVSWMGDRDRLVQWDKQRLQALDSALKDDDACTAQRYDELLALYGRSPTLDRITRRLRAGDAPATEEIRAAVTAALQGLD